MEMEDVEMSMLEDSMDDEPLPATNPDDDSIPNKVQSYLDRIWHAWQVFQHQASTANDSTHTRVSADALAQALLSACRLAWIASPVDHEHLPRVPVVQRPGDLPAATREDQVDNNNDNNDDNDKDDEWIPYQRRRVDYVRDILRAMAPLQLDVAAHVCTILQQEAVHNNSNNSNNQSMEIPHDQRVAAWILFSLWLPVAPQIAPMASHLFGLPAFTCVLEPAPQNASEQVVLMEATHAICEFYVIFLCDYQGLLSFWNWSVLFDWLPGEETATVTPPNAMVVDTPDVYLYNPHFDTRDATHWHAIRSIAYTLNLRPAAKAVFVQKFGATMYAQRVAWVMHPFDVHREEVMAQKLALQGQTCIQWMSDGRAFECPSAEHIRRVWPLHPFLVDCGSGRTLVRGHLETISNTFHKPQSRLATASNQTMVRTKTTADNLTAIARVLAICPHPPPILVCGPAGAGKSSLIRELARMVVGGKMESGDSTPHDDFLLEIHVDEDTDIKTLVGCYTTTDIPGQFAWRPGALTVAVREGKWVLLEDLDKIPLDIQASLIKLLKDRLLPLGNGKVEPCHQNFRIFATLTTAEHSKTTQATRKVFRENLWAKVDAKPLPLVELQEISLHSYPDLPLFVIEAVLRIFRELDLSGRSYDTRLNSAEPEKENDQTTLLAQTFDLGRPVSVRDLFKVMARIANSVVFEKGASYATESQRTACLAETVDVFAADCSSTEHRQEFIRAFAAPNWKLSTNTAHHYIFSRNPTLHHLPGQVHIGRAILPAKNGFEDEHESGTYACTGYTLRLMESIGVCIRQNEPILLVGESGGGKTSILQQLARRCGRDLVVQNLSLQTDSGDLLGGFRPLEIVHVARQVYQEFVDLFTATFSRKHNEAFLKFASTCLKKKQWAKLAQCFVRASRMGVDKLKIKNNNDAVSQIARADWKRFVELAERFEQQQIACETGLAFVFSEGILVEAIKTGKWILLDEINLASSETLQRLCGLLDDSTSSITLTERGDSKAIKRHSNFRLFAAMNPATDAGKKDLPPSIRSRFTELYVDEILDPLELRGIAGKYLRPCLANNGVSPENTETVGNVISLYLKARHLADRLLVDGSGHRPRYTLRSLTRTLTATQRFVAGQKMTLSRALVEGFELNFQGCLDPSSISEFGDLLSSHFSDGMSSRNADHPGRNPGGRSNSNDYVLLESFWIPKGPKESVDWSQPGPDQLARFILTPNTKSNLRRLGRAIASGPYPILLEGPTSAGKTTLVEYLAAYCGHHVVRINNHEHTDIQEYTGGFSTDDNGKLGFRDGLLVSALRKGYWVILDELNLAPTEVLEALNRLLDDNRELYLPEINETVKPHASFRLFATQNPSGAYGGRKPLSRAFRNRFLDLYVGDMPPPELVTVLEKRAGLAPSHAKLLVATMKALRRHRSASSLFMGKDGFMTPRDLLRWAQRAATSKSELAQEGFMLLAERLRSDDEKVCVLEEIEKHFKCRVNPEALYFDPSSDARVALAAAKAEMELSNNFLSKIAPTKSLLRLLTLVMHCMKRREPVLLVGDTGCGKTTVVQLIAHMQRTNLHVLNCHATTETSDIIGGLRPVRGRSSLCDEMLRLLRKLVASLPDSTTSGKASPIPSYVLSENGSETLLSKSAAAEMIDVARNIVAAFNQNSGFERNCKRQKIGLHPSAVASDDSDEEMVDIMAILTEMETLYGKYSALFEWSDGPLVHAMRNGEMILLDEMSLAEDAVLERLNSVLEPGRSLVLAEKGVSAVDESVVIAEANFQLFATMNPGGDFGKRELSPALRSRFTEVWVPPVADMNDIGLAVKQCMDGGALVHHNAPGVGDSILRYVDWFNNGICADASGPFAELSLSLRDILSWASFVETMLTKDSSFSVPDALFHGACLTHLDGLGLGTAMSLAESAAVRSKAQAFLRAEQEQYSQQNAVAQPFASLSLSVQDGRFGIHLFTIPLGPEPLVETGFNFHAPTTSLNLARILRGMQLSKPILLEGPPGTGKTTVVAALAAASGHHLVRINLSEQTDMGDLLGGDMPAPGGVDEEAAFKWVDGVLLSAIKAGHWVLLDELNLASQSVLEGLNSILDHRANVFIPEIGQMIECPSSFRVFAAQNPFGQGSGRKGLPKSFLNRFIKVHVEGLTTTDQDLILTAKFPSIPTEKSKQMISFNNKIHEEIVEAAKYGHHGSPWEFNLRDLFRWCELITSDATAEKSLLKHTAALYTLRLRNKEDRGAMNASFRSIFGECVSSYVTSAITLHKASFFIDGIRLSRIQDMQNCHNVEPIKKLGSMIGSSEPLRAMASCIDRRWPCLLIGSSSSPKEDAITALAELCNACVVDVDLAPSSDVSELLGSFEQVDEREELLKNTEILVQRALVHLANASADISAAKVEAKLIFDLMKRRGTDVQIKERCMELLSMLTSRGISQGQDDQLGDVKEYFESMAEPTGNDARNTALFEWKDGLLVQAMMKGYWVHLRNANLCSASVLDRLNPLLEPGGSLLLLECGISDSTEGNHRVVKCHPNFRVFLTMDAERGEVSRAMRNRCVEIFFDDDVSSNKHIDKLDTLSTEGMRILSAQELDLFLSSDEERCGSCLLSDLRRGLRSDENLTIGSSVHDFTLLPASPLQTQNRLFEPFWANMSWEARTLQYFCSNGERLSEVDTHVLGKVLPPHILEKFNRCCSSDAVAGDFATRLLLIFFLRGRETDMEARFRFFLGLGHSLSRNAHFMARKIRAIVEADQQNSLSCEEKTISESLQGLSRVSANRIVQALVENAWALSDPSKQDKSVLFTSFLLFQGGIDRSLIDCSLTPLMYHFFERFEQWWAVLLRKRCHFESNLISGFARIASRRDQLWNLLSSLPYTGTSQGTDEFGFSFEEFFVQWIWFRKAFATVVVEVEDGDFAVVSRSLAAWMKRIDSIVLGESEHSLFVHVIKRSVNPLVPKEPEIWNIWLALKALADDLSPTDLIDCSPGCPAPFSVDLCVMASKRHPGVVGIDDLKVDFLFVASMLYLAASSKGTDIRMKYVLERGHDVVQKTAKRLVAQQVEFLKRLKTLQCQFTSMEYDEYAAAETLEEIATHGTTYIEFSDTILGRYANVQLSPLMENLCDKYEEELVRVLCRDTTVEGPSCSTEYLKDRLRNLIDTRLSSAWSNIAVLGAYQTLLWLLEESPWEKIQQEEVTEQLIGLIINSFALKTWSSPRRILQLTSMDLGIPERLVSHQENSSSNVTKQVAFGMANIEAEPQLDIVATTALQLLGSCVLQKPLLNSASSLFTIENFSVRGPQLTSMIKYFVAATTNPQKPGGDRWYIVYILIDTLRCLRGSIKNEEFERLLHLCSDPIGLLESSKQCFMDICNSSTNSLFKQLCPQLLEPLFDAIRSACCLRVNRRNSKDLALSKIYLGLLRFHLFLPRSILDPGLKHAAKVRLLQKDIARLESEIVAETLYETMATGAYPSCSDMEEKVSELETKAAKQKKKIIKRPNSAAPFPDLYRNFHDFAIGFADVAKTKTLAETFCLVGSADCVQRIRTIQTSMQAFCKRSQRTFHHYEEILSPLIAAISLVSQGFDDLILSVPKIPLYDFTPGMKVGFAFPPMYSSNKQLTLPDLPRSAIKEQWSCLVPLVLSEMFRLLVAGKSLSSASSSKVASDWSQCLKFLLARVELKEASAKQESYPKTDDEADEENFLKQFPDHRKIFVVDSDSGTMAEDSIAVEDEDNFIPSLSHQDYELIAWIHTMIFSPSEISDEERIKSFHFGYKAAAQIYQAGYFCESSVCHENFVGAHVFELCLNTPNCYFKSTGLGIETIPRDYEDDFQIYPSPDQAIKLTRPLQLLIGRVTALLATFPGNALLTSIFKVADRIRKLDALHTSAAKLLVGLQELLKHGQDWEQHASRRVLIGEPLITLRGLVAELRKLELDSWSKLLSSREKDINRRARRHWVRLQAVFLEFLDETTASHKLPKNFRSNQWTPKWVLKGLPISEFMKDCHCEDMESSENFKKLVRTLDTFVLTSKFGEVSGRLQMLRSFGNQFKEEAQIHQNKLLVVLSRTVLSLCDYYDQFSAHLSAVQIHFRKPFEDKLRNEVKLAKWDQQSYYALADTVTRNHRKLMGILKEYDEVLKTPLSLILEKEQQGSMQTGDSPSTEVPSIKTMFPLAQDSDDSETHQKNTKGYVGRAVWRANAFGIQSGERIGKIPQYAKQMNSLLENIQSKPEIAAVFGRAAAADVCSSVFERLEMLQKKSTTRSMKERALVDLFRELKHQGYSHMKWGVPKEFNQFGDILHLLPPSKAGRKQAIAQDCERYFLRCLVELNRLRAEGRIGGNRHMTQRHIQMMIGYADHIGFISAQQRTLIASFQTNMEELSTILEPLRLLDSSILNVDLKMGNKLAECKEKFESATEAIRHFVLMIKAIQHQIDGEKGKLWVSKLLSDLALWLEKVSLEGPNFNHVLMTDKIVIHCVLAEQTLMKLKGILEESQLNSRSLGYLPDTCFSTVLQETKEALDVIHATSGLHITSNHVSSVLSSSCQDVFTDVIQNALIVAQQCTKKEDESADICSCHRKASSQLMNSNVRKLASACESLVKELTKLSHSSYVSQETLAYCSAVSADVAQLCLGAIQLLEYRLDQYITFHRGCVKLNYILLRVFRTLIERGFCSDETEETEADGEGEGGMTFTDEQDGTGMGEGEGKRDVTDEIENEEQLLGLKNDDQELDDQNTEKDSKELDKDEAEQGMEMENDFGGEMYDMPQQEDQGDEDDEDDKEELDREMGDDAGEQEDVVDEKLWDGSDEENEEQEEKFETDNSAKGQEKSDEMTTKDDEDNSQETDKKGPEQQSSLPEDDIEQDPVEEPGTEQDFRNDENDDTKEENHGVDVRNEGNDDYDEDMELEDDLNIDGEDAEENDNNDDANSEDENDPRVPEESTQDVSTPPENDDPNEENEVEDEGDEMKEEADAIQQTEALQLESTNEDPTPEDTVDDQDDQVLDKIESHEKSQAGLGVSASNGKDAVDDADDDGDDAGQANQESEHDQPEDSNMESQGQNGGGSASQRGSNTSNEKEAPNDQSVVSKKMPNPLQNFGDAKKFWHEKLNVVDQSNPDDVGAETNQDEMETDSTDGKGDYEYTDEKQKGTTQTLGEMEDETLVEEIEKDPINESTRVDGDNDEKQKENTSTGAQRDRKKEATEMQKNPTDIMDVDAEMNSSEDEAELPEANDEGSCEEEDDEDERIEEDDTGTGRVVSDLSQLKKKEPIDLEEHMITEDNLEVKVHERQHLESRERWGTIYRETYPLARRLCEKLRLVLEPLVASKLRGDYRTGKRINMKRIIGYIASSYRKDKIWLRRTKPAKRNYRILLAVDDSESMKKSGAGQMALKAMATLANGMSQLEVGEIGIASFGDEMRLLHSFQQPFTYESGVDVIGNIQFDQQRTRTALCIESALMALDESSLGDTSSMQIVFLISDGRIERDSRATLRRLIREMMELNILMAMIIVEGNETAKDSIVNMKEVTFVDGKPKVKQFMDDYPFPYYLVLDDMANLPTVLGDALRQWFEMLTRLQA